MQIGLITICTGKYQKYIEDFVASANKNFLSNHNLVIFVFTDAVQEITKRDNVFLVPEQSKPWPFSTLDRFTCFCNAYRLFTGCDVLYFMDGDMYVDKLVGDEILPDGNFKLVGVAHPGFYNQNTGSFERDRRSTSAVNPKDDTTYHQGCLFGGFFKDFIKLCFACKKNIDIDLSNNVIASWHDESHMNHYFIYNERPKTLPPCFAYPQNCGHEKFGVPKDWKILHLAKDAAEMRAV